MCARRALRALAELPAARFGHRAGAWQALVSTLPALLRADADRVLDAVGRVDALSAFDGAGEAVRDDHHQVERALVALWVGLAGHPGLRAELTLPGPFPARFVDPHAPRVLALDRARALLATARGAVAVTDGASRPIDELVVGLLPTAGPTVIVGDDLEAPADEVTARVRAALTATAGALPGGGLERVTIGRGDAAYGEARVDPACDPACDPASLVASAQAAFVEAAAGLQAVLRSDGTIVEHGRKLAPLHVLARACGNVAALPWRAERAAAAEAIVGDLDDLAVVAELTPTGAALVDAVRAIAGDAFPARRRALLVNVDHDDFVYSHLFARSVERRCAERDLWVDRIDVDHAGRRDLEGELGRPLPAPLADGVEILVDSERDPVLAPVLRRLGARRYDVIVVNVRPGLFYDLEAAGIFRAPTLLWSRHLQTGLAEERARRGRAPGDVRDHPIRVWGLLGNSGSDLHASLVDAGLRGTGHHWPLDLEFFQSTATRRDGRVFAGGDSGRDWPLFVEAVRSPPLDVQLVTSRAPSELPTHVRVEARLPLWRFRDALAAASIAAIPLVASAGAAGITVLPMAMALGVAVVATRSRWVEQYVRDGEEALLVPAGDVGAFRDALMRLHDDPGLRERLAANARRRVVELCDLDAFTREMFGTLG